MADIASAVTRFYGLPEDFRNGFRQARRATQLPGHLLVVSDVLGGIGEGEAVAVEVPLQRRTHHLAQDAGIAGAIEHDLVKILPMYEQIYFDLVGKSE